MVSYIKGRTQAKGIRKQHPEANIWAPEEWEWEMEKLHNEEIHSLHRSPNIVRGLSLED